MSVGGILARTQAVSLDLCYVYKHMKHVLEQSSLFPYIAWTAIIVFGVITIMLAFKFNEEMSALASNRDYLETMIEAVPD